MALTVLDVGVVPGDAVEADVMLLASGHLRVSHAGRQGDDEALHKLDGMGADAVIVRIQQENDVTSHGRHHVPAGLLELADDSRLHHPLRVGQGGTETERWAQDIAHSITTQRSTNDGGYIHLENIYRTTTRPWALC